MHLVLELCLWFVAVLTVSLFIVYNWRRRWLYYYGSKLPGPFNFPLIGAAYLLLQGRKGIENIALKLVAKYPPVFKIWLGPHLYISTSRPQDIELILTRENNKGEFNELFSDFLKESLSVAPVGVWKERRKVFNPTFNMRVLNSFLPLFVKQANILMDDLKENCENGGKPFDVFPKMWKATLNAACETLGDVDPALLKGKDQFLSDAIRAEEIMTERFFNIHLHLNFFWKFSSLRKEAVKIYNQSCDFIEQIINTKGVSASNDESETLKDDPILRKRFLNTLLEIRQANGSYHQVILEEAPFMLLAASETTAIAMSSVLLILGMYPDVQEKIFDELSSIFEDSDREMTLEDLNRMDYLERVIKETMRLVPTLPLILRTLEEDMSLDPYVFPTGSRVLIPIIHLHRRAELWPDPFKFDPDRFLPEEIRKRHRCAYIPFSVGPRNCIGLKYAMLSMKITVASILRCYKVTKSVDYRTIEEIEYLFLVVAKAKKGYKIILKKRM